MGQLAELSRKSLSSSNSSLPSPFYAINLLGHLFSRISHSHPRGTVPSCSSILYASYKLEAGSEVLITLKFNLFGKNTSQEMRCTSHHATLAVPLSALPWFTNGMIWRLSLAQWAAVFPEAGGTTVRETKASNDAGEDVHRHTGSLVHCGELLIKKDLKY